MSFQAYLDTIRAKTGKTPDDFAVLAAQAGYQTYPQVMAWLKQEFGLGHGHCNVIAQLLTKRDELTAAPGDKLQALFAGAKAAWREPFAALEAEVRRFSDDVSVLANRTYVNLLRGKAKFGIVQVASASRMGIGIKLPGVEPSGIAEAAGAWNAMVTHRIQLTDPDAIPQEAVVWLRRGHDALA